MNGNYKALQAKLLKSGGGRCCLREDQQPLSDLSTFAAKLSAMILRILCAICCAEDRDTLQYEIENISINSLLDEEVSGNFNSKKPTKLS